MQILKKLRYFIFLLIPVGLFAFPNPGKGTKNEKIPDRILCFTTTSAVKIEAVFGALPADGTVYHVTIEDQVSGKSVYDQQVQPTEVFKTKKRLIFSVTNLKVQQWTPVHPALYRLRLTIKKGQQMQEQTMRIGFRLFSAANGHLYLNGHPIFLRGIAINPPGRGIPGKLERSRDFALDYVRFMKSIHVNFIRIPDDTTWYNVCDELGMMVFGGNYSGTVDGKKPPEDYDAAVSWYENVKYPPIASHPSLMIYAMTNEVAFSGKLMPKWQKFLSYAHDKLRTWDSTRVYIGNAGYGYGQSGDICDLHRYWGWYYSSPFTFLHIRRNEDIIPMAKRPGQPVTFTECVGNYTGPGGQYNLTPHHKNPGSQLNWTGHASWDLQAQLADRHQSFTFRSAVESFRQLRDINPDLSGLFPFTILFHNWHTIKSFVDMDPKAVTRQARISYQPILVSWECFTPNIYSGATIRPVAHVINDDDEFRDLKGATLVYQLLDFTKTAVLSGSISLPEIKYYATYKKTLPIKLPEDLPDGQYQLEGQIIQGDSVVSQNYYDLAVAGKDFVQAGTTTGQKPVYLYDPGGRTGQALTALGLKTTDLKIFTTLKGRGNSGVLIIGEDAADNEIVTHAGLIKDFVDNGGRVICLKQDSQHQDNLNGLLDHKIAQIHMNLDTAVYPPPARPSRNGYNVNVERIDHPVFAGISRENLEYWSDYSSWTEDSAGFPAIYPVTDGFTFETDKLLDSIALLADYGPGLNAIAVAEAFQGRGSILLCGMDLIRRCGLDPFAARLISNMVHYSSSGIQHETWVKIEDIIRWGDYASEKGLITGVTSGLLLNSTPRRTGSYSKVPLVITKEGDELAGGGSGFNTNPGLQYVPNGRRPFGPYKMAGFGNVPKADTALGNTGKGIFYCQVPAGKTSAATLVWNPADTELTLAIRINGQTVHTTLEGGARKVVSCPVNSTHIAMEFSGDRRLVLLQTSFL